MSEKLTVKYYANNKSANEPVQASEDAARYDLYSAEAKTLNPHSCTCLTLELRMAIPKGYHGKIFPRSGFLQDHFVTCDSGVTDRDFRGTVTLLINHGSKHYTVRAGDRIGQMVFMKKFNINFEKVSDPDLLGKRERDMSGFGSTGASLVIVKKPFYSQEILVIDD